LKKSEKKKIEKKKKSGGELIEITQHRLFLELYKLIGN